MNNQFIHTFENVAMPDASLWPAMPVRTLYNGILQPLMYTHPTYAADTSYTPQVTVYDFPISNLVREVVLKQKIVAKPATASCGLMVQGGVGVVLVARGTITLTTPWQPRDTIINDTIMPPDYTWNDSTIATQNFNLQIGDTLRYGRYFKLGTYQQGDTAAIQGYLYNSSDYIKMKVNLRSAATNAVIRTLDSCMLSSSGFTQSGNLTDSGISKTGIASTISGAVYLTLEATRGASNNSFQIYNTESYDDDATIDEMPGPPFTDTSFKVSQPDQPQPQGKTSFVSGITMMVRPNPFRTLTQITLEVPSEVVLNVTVFDVLGHQVRTLYNDLSGKDHYNFTLDSKQLTPGMYFVRVQAGSEIVTRKVELVR